MTDTLRKAAEQAQEALSEYASYGCPACPGDCSSANPPVYRCPTRMYLNAIAALDAALAAEEPEQPRVCDPDWMWEEAEKREKPKGGDANVSGRNADPKTPKHDISPGSKCEPAGASDAELVARLMSAECSVQWVQGMFREAAAAIERLTRDVERRAKRERTTALKTDAYIEEVEKALAAEREARQELQQTFDMRWKCDMRAVKKWREAGGDELTWPDHADLCVWLMEALAAMTNERDELKTEVAALNSVDPIERQAENVVREFSAVHKRMRDAEKALASEREAHEQTAKDSRDNFNAACREKARAEAAEARVASWEKSNDAWKQRYEEAEARVRELEAKASESRRQKPA